jgi:hypothetical protein
MVNVTIKLLRDDVPVWNTFDSTFVIGTFDGDEDYDALFQVFQHYITDISDISLNGLKLDSASARLVTFWAGGDLKFLSVIYGLRGDFVSGYLPLLPFCDCPKELLGDTTRKCETRTLIDMKRLAHVCEATAYTCPGCGDKVELVSKEKVTNAVKESWHQSHKGVSFHQ